MICLVSPKNHGRKWKMVGYLLEGPIFDCMTMRGRINRSILEMARISSGSWQEDLETEPLDYSFTPTGALQFCIESLFYGYQHFLRSLSTCHRFFPYRFSLGSWCPSSFEVTEGNTCVGCVYEKNGLKLKEFGPVILASGLVKGSPAIMKVFFLLDV